MVSADANVPIPFSVRVGKGTRMINSLFFLSVYESFPS